MYTFTSPRKRTALDLLVISSFVAGVILLTLPAMLKTILIGTPAERWLPLVCRLLGVLGLAAGVYLTARYSLRMYHYTIEIPDPREPDERDFVVTECFFNRQAVVTRISLRDIDCAAVAVINRKDRRAAYAAYPRTWRCFHYTGLPILREECLIPCPIEECLIIIPSDPHMVKILRESFT